MKRFIKITFVIGLCVRLVLVASFSYAGDTLADQMRRLQETAIQVQETAIQVNEEVSEQIGGLLDELEDIDPDDNAACCEAIDEYESISCSGIRNRWARFACIMSRIRAKESVVDQCGVDPTSSSLLDRVNYFLIGAECDREDLESASDRTADQIIRNIESESGSLDRTRKQLINTQVE